MLQEYAVDRTFVHIRDGNNVKSMVRHYGYKRADPAVDLPKQVPDDFIIRRWHRC